MSISNVVLRDKLVTSDVSKCLNMEMRQNCLLFYPFENTSQNDGFNN
jgi:hypothetical protein